MTVIELSDEQAAALKARAAAQGLTLEAWLKQLAGIDSPKGGVGIRPSLEELIAKCDLSAPLSAEDRTWLDVPPVGREA